MRKVYLIWLVVAFALQGCSLMTRPAIGLKQLAVADYVEDSGAQQLAVAADRGDDAAVKRLIASGISVNAAGKGLRPLTALMILAQSKRGLETLLRHGADASAMPEGASEPVSAIDTAIMSTDDPAYLRLLIKYGLNPNVTDSGQEPPIFFAFYWNKWEFVKILIEEGKADINAMEHGRTLGEDEDYLISGYIGFSRFKEVYWLLERGARVNAKLHYAPEGFEHRIGAMPDIEGIFWSPINPKGDAAAAANLAWQKKCQEFLLAKGVRRPLYNGHFDSKYEQLGLPVPPYTANTAH